MQYEVTIGIPVYNAEKYIRETLDSVLAQSFKSLEILIVDDCGTDHSISIIQEYQTKHSRGKDIRIVSQPYNKGIGETRNLIVEEAQGRYLFFMDADDTITPNAIKLLYDNAKHYDAEIVYGSHERIELFGKTTSYIKRQYPLMCFLKENEFAIWAYQKYDNLPAMTWNFLVDLDIYRDNLLKYQPINYWEDFLMTMDLPIYITRAVLIPDITYHYYCREGSLSNYQRRSYINKMEIQKTINAIADVKKKSESVKGKPFFSSRMCKVMMTCFFMAKHIISNNYKIRPPFSNKEIKDLMSSPISLFDVLSSRKCWTKNVFLYVLGILPPSLSVWLIKHSI